MTGIKIVCVGRVKEDFFRDGIAAYVKEIRKKYSTGLFSLMDLAKEYNVSKKSILLIVDPESKKKNDDHIKSHWKDYKPSLEERNKIMKEHRHYKQELYLKGKLK